MTVDIFIRTYDKDLEWLRYCLRSIDKFVSGHRNIIICISTGQAKLLKDWSLTKEQVVEWEPVTANGYIDQQINKLNAHKYSDADYILYVDSDVCFYKPTNVLTEFFKNGKPIIFKTPYEFVGVALCWKSPTENVIGEIVEFEYMRRLPIIYRRDTIESFNKQVSYIDYAKDAQAFSEFNALGAYADIYENENYYFWDTIKEPELPVQCIIQGWSWGGLTKNIKHELEEILK